MMRHLVTIAAFWTAFSIAARALGQAATPTSADPVNAIWSLLGGTPIAALLYLWVRSEQADRRAAVEAKEATVAKMLTMFQGDAEHKAAIRERLAAQDTILGKLVEQGSKTAETVNRLDAALARRGP